MIDPKKDLAAWLNQEPSKEDLSINEDGSVYQSIDIIKPKLDIAFPSWQTQNFQHTYLLAPYGTFFCSGSVELVLDYNLFRFPFVPKACKINKEEISSLIQEFEKSPNTIYSYEQNLNNKRILVGAATFDTEKYFNTKEKNSHWAAVCLSLAIVNAAQNIAPFFGKNLNKQLQIEQDPQKKIFNTIKDINAWSKKS